MEWTCDAREEHYVGRRAIGMEVRGRRKRGRLERRWLDRVKDDINDKGLSGRKCKTVLHGGVHCHTLTHIKVGLR